MSARIRLRCLSTGVVRGTLAQRGVRRYIGRRWAPTALPVNVFLVEHPRGRLLFDTGQTAAAAEDGWFPWWHPFFRLARFELDAGDEAAAQLARSGVRPGDVRWVVLSHLHTDHVGGLGPFRDSEVLLARTEWERARGVGGSIRGYLPTRWPNGISPTLLDFSGPRVGPFRGSYDVAGDGSMLVVPTPGHTPGHVSLLVDNGWRCLLAGDVALTPAQLTSTSPALAEFCRNERVTVLTTHDPDAVAIAERICS